MADGRADDASWSRAYLASSGLGTARVRQRQVSAEWHEASGADLARPRFAELAHHRDVDVREVLARRPDCPLAVLASLAHDARAAVRVAVAANPTANPSVLAQLGRDRDAAVLKAVARNRATPADTRARLATHRRPEVRRAAERATAELAAAPVVQDSGEGLRGVTLPPELRDRAAATHAALGHPAPTDAGSMHGAPVPAGPDGGATDRGAPTRRTSLRAYAPRPAVGRDRAGDAETGRGGAPTMPGMGRRTPAVSAEAFFPEGPRPATG
ncbi:hypothetical protein [Demequina sp. NBRC 110056]|uniref:hypothetical protein n=1 Tax=Demequina sp. NBRC 110056 TaxID=1570345 RepID=UPI000A00C5F6|nr:hypothetical protein [Demequina sp. NBRC 110056]